MGTANAVREIQALGDPENGGDFCVHVPSCSRALRPLRALLRRWLDARGIHSETADAMVLAVDEAAANAIEHAAADERGSGRPSSFIVKARIDDVADDHPFHPSIHRTLEVWVTDDGVWARRARPTAGGRGLRVIGAMTDECTVERTRRGTRVRMARFIPVDPPDRARPGSSDVAGTSNRSERKKVGSSV
jgi:anti-sigma regulatory factor (Ser/Thr protein kinase)